MRYIASLLAICLLLGCVSPSGDQTATPSTTTTTIQECDRMAENIVSEISALNVCSEDDQCRLTAYSCPFGCRIYSTLNDSSKVDEAIKQYGSACGYCDTKCSISGGDLLCNNRKCVTSLTNLMLQSETSYRSNGTVQITLKNSLNRSIYIDKCNDIRLELRAEGRWNT
ncbi:MAG: hypothetical protein NTU61_06030, partial [Candidatus Altiarchaeota archaeon]|nr:hypothetical protein [Candidatus Altiarchaeota archaeon]